MEKIALSNSAWKKIGLTAGALGIAGGSGFVGHRVGFRSGAVRTADEMARVFTEANAQENEGLMNTFRNFNAQENQEIASGAYIQGVNDASAAFQKTKKPKLKKMASDAEIAQMILDEYFEKDAAWGVNTVKNIAKTISEHRNIGKLVNTAKSELASPTSKFVGQAGLGRKSTLLHDVEKGLARRKELRGEAVKTIGEAVRSPFRKAQSFFKKNIPEAGVNVPIKATAPSTVAPISTAKSGMGWGGVAAIGAGSAAVGLGAGIPIGMAGREKRASYNYAFIDELQKLGYDEASINKMIEMVSEE